MLTSALIMARPAKLTPEVQARIIEAVQAGNYMETAAQYANIGLSTFYRWMAEGEGEKAPKRQRESLEKRFCKQGRKQRFVM